MCQAASGAIAMESSHTFVFVDIAGFTALTETHGAHAAADLVDRFVEIAGNALSGTGKIVDRSGDAVFVVCADPDEALDFASHLFATASREPDFPALRVGLHHGKALERRGTYFGPDVNVAARVAAQASGDQVLATEMVAAAARIRNIAVRPLGPVAFKNVLAPVDLFSLQLLEPREPSAIDPVCRMRVDPDQASGRLRFSGVDYWFCSLDCAGRFAAQPESFAQNK